MAIKNRIQRNFKRQMQEIEYDSLKKEKRNQGLFSNKHYKLKFYGENFDPIERHNKIVRELAKTIRNIIFLMIKTVLIIIFILVLLALSIKTNKDNGGKSPQYHPRNYSIMQKDKS